MTFTPLLPFFFKVNLTAFTEWLKILYLVMSIYLQTRLNECDYTIVSQLLAKSLGVIEDALLLTPYKCIEILLLLPNFE